MVTVHELFDLPIGHLLNRDETVKLYTERSRIELTTPAIAPSGSDPAWPRRRDHHGQGNHRWIRTSMLLSNARVTAWSEFGMKQDITAEKKLFDEIRLSRGIRPVDQPAEPGSVPTTFDTLARPRRRGRQSRCS